MDTQLLSIKNLKEKKKKIAGKRVLLCKRKLLLFAELKIYLALVFSE